MQPTRRTLRWGLREYNDIRLLDVHTGAQRTLTHRARYFSPDISADGRRVVAVQVTSQGQAALHILSTEDGRVLDSLPNPDGYFYVMPRWCADDRQVVSGVRDGQGRMSLLLADMGSHTFRALLPFSFHVIAYPCASGDTIYFSARQGGGSNSMAYVQGFKRPSPS